MIPWIKRHSLSLTLMGGGVILCGLSIPLQEGTWFDLISQTGGGMMTSGLVFYLSGPLREVNKPEEPGKKPRKKRTPPAP